jgi:hypothetical protein
MLVVQFLCRAVAVVPVATSLLLRVLVKSVVLYLFQDPLPLKSEPLPMGTLLFRRAAVESSVCAQVTQSARQVMSLLQQAQALQLMAPVRPFVQVIQPRLMEPVEHCLSPVALETLEARSLSRVAPVKVVLVVLLLFRRDLLLD